MEDILMPAFNVSCEKDSNSIMISRRIEVTQDTMTENPGGCCPWKVT
jgi:hypothetical protein